MPFWVNDILVFLAEVSGDTNAASASRDFFLRDVLHRLELRYTRSLHLRDEGTRPCLGTEEGHLSLSHTHRWIGLAYSPSSPVGFDLEEKARRLVNPEAIARRFFTSEDLRSPGAVSAREELLQLWTHKEALLKIEGRGLAEEICEHGHLSLRELQAKWHVQDLTGHAEFPPTLFGAVASRADAGPIKIIRVPLR